MSNWIVLTRASASAERVAINLDKATAMVDLDHATRIQFGQDDFVEVKEPVLTIVKRAEAKQGERA